MNAFFKNKKKLSLFLYILNRAKVTGQHILYWILLEDTFYEGVF